MRRIADRLRTLAAAADTDALAAELTLVVSTDPAAVVGELVVDCANAVAARSSPLGVEDVFTVFVHDTGGRPVSIDDLEPGIRAALRAIVAELNGDSGARDAEVGLAVAGSSLEALRAITHCLRWSTDLAAGGALPAFSCSLPD
ncbi:hypothetical protein [Amycolatopsis sp. 195334CR]|uniref:hypothetical protein n=1 Tax=Amycolatopsis sp. 195334CR TaxID=2814588 RepID=UPI001A8DE4BC|nr:hypothetical protein [Amycolatopsis sp. 195334CR]MBN6038405.1 hypothetical protein [Amycolatopsis sp. 195334CR]